MDSRKCSVFVGNLDPNTTDDRFLAYFRRECAGVRAGSEGGKIVRDDKGRSKKYGFVNFIDAASANRVVAKKNHVIDGRKVICRIQNRKRKPVAPRQTIEPKYLREIHVRNLNVSTTSQQLRDYFQKFGSIVNAYVSLDENKRSKGFGFVEYQNSSMVDEVQDKRPHIICNKEVQTARTYPDKKIPTHLKKATTVLFVLNYNERVSEEDIEEYFGEFGNITSVSSHKKKRPDSVEDIKYLELHFDDYDAVDKICLADISSKHTINGCTVKVTKCLEDGLAELQDTSAGNSSRKARNSKDSGLVSAPVPSAPLFPAEELNQAPFNPYFNANHQQASYPSLDTRNMNPQPGSYNNDYANVGPNLYPSFETKPSNPQPAQQHTASSFSGGSVRRSPPRPPTYVRPERRKEADCVIL